MKFKVGQVYRSEIGVHQIIPRIQNDFKDWILFRKSAAPKEIYLICNSFDVSVRSNLLDGYPDWKLSKESYERIFIKRGILSSVKKDLNLMI